MKHKQLLLALAGTGFLAALPTGRGRASTISTTGPASLLRGSGLRGLHAAIFPEFFLNGDADRAARAGIMVCNGRRSSGSRACPGRPRAATSR